MSPKLYNFLLIGSKLSPPWTYTLIFCIICSKFLPKMNKLESHKCNIIVLANVFEPNLPKFFVFVSPSNLNYEAKVYKG